MVKRENCKECSGQGWYTIHNAYDKFDVKKITCEYCVPTGVNLRLHLN